MSIPKVIPLSQQELSFVDTVKQTCTEHGVKFSLVDKQHIKSDGTECVGYFSSEPLELVCATKRSDFIPILVHESCHLDQWVEDPKLFEDEEVIDSWLQGKEFDEKVIAKAIKDSISIELDCEKRSVKKITDFGLNINIDQYIQGANAYIIFYNFVKKNRKWYKKNDPPHNKQQVYSKMPKKFMADSYYYKLTPRLEKLFKKVV